MFVCGAFATPPFLTNCPIVIAGGGRVPHKKPREPQYEAPNKVAYWRFPTSRDSEIKAAIKLENAYKRVVTKIDRGKKKELDLLLKAENDEINFRNAVQNAEIVGRIYRLFREIVEWRADSKKKLELETQRIRSLQKKLDEDDLIIGLITTLVKAEYD